MKTTRADWFTACCVGVIAGVGSLIAWILGMHLALSASPPGPLVSALFFVPVAVGNPVIFVVDYADRIGLPVPAPLYFASFLLSGLLWIVVALNADAWWQKRKRSRVESRKGPTSR